MGTAHCHQWLLWRTLALLCFIGLSNSTKLSDDSETNSFTRKSTSNEAQVDAGINEESSLQEHVIDEVVHQHPKTDTTKENSPKTTSRPATLLDKELKWKPENLLKGRYHTTRVPNESSTRETPKDIFSTSTTTRSAAGKKTSGLYEETSRKRMTVHSHSITITTVTQSKEITTSHPYSRFNSDALKFVPMTKKDSKDVSEVLKPLYRSSDASRFPNISRNSQQTMLAENLTSGRKKDNPRNDRFTFNDVRNLTDSERLLGAQSTQDTLKRKLTIDDEVVTEFHHNGDKFRCNYCLCFFSQTNKIIANCSKQSYRDIPLTLPSDIWYLSLSLNFLEEINQTRLHSYVELHTLDISGNWLSVIRNCSSNNVTMKIELLDLSHNNMIDIDDNAFVNMVALRNLSLRHNRLTKISNLTFFGLVKLTILDLGYNDLSDIEFGAFDNFPYLEQLFLNKNKRLTYRKKRFNPRLFVNLKALSTLHIQGNMRWQSPYPSEALSKIKNLQTLVIDGLPRSEFSSEMKTLKYLRDIKFGKGGFCHLAIKETFFQFTPYLEKVEIIYCTIMSVDPKAYKHLQYIKTLSFLRIFVYTLDDALNGLEFLQNSSLQSLNLVRVQHTVKLCVILRAAQAKYLTYIDLKVLDLSDNNLSLLRDDFTSRLPKTLETLKLRRNKFTMPIWPISGHSLFGMKHLKFVDFSGQNLGYKIVIQNEQFPLCQTNTEENVIDTYFDSRSTKSKTIASKRGPTIQQSFCSDESNNGRKETSTTLKILRASYYPGFGYAILMKRFPKTIDSLEEVDFSNSFLSEWGSKRLPQIIKKADLSNNFCKKMYPGFLQTRNRLEKLNVQNNFLGDSFSEDKRGLIFERGKQLVYLDLSHNMLHHLPKKVFRGLSNIRTLVLKNNRIQMLDIEMGHMKKLNFLDLSANSIQWIQKSTRDDLDNIAKHSMVGLRIDLTRNPLPCTCEGAEIIQWLATTKVHVKSKDYLQCRFPDGSVKYVGDLSLRAQSIYRACAPIKTIIIAVIVMLLLCVICLAVGFGLRYKWKLYYYRNIALTKLFGRTPKQPMQDGAYTFDAYVVYAEEDIDFVLNTCVQELEVKRCHRLCIEERDFLPGSFMATNIICAVQSSAVTMPIVTPYFYTEDYTEYAIKMAMCESANSKRKTLHLCMYQHVPIEELSADFQLVLKNDHYTEMPPLEEELSEAARQTFWDHLSEAIGHHSNRNLPPRLQLNDIDRT